MTPPAGGPVLFDEVLAAQRTFRMLIEALARPGTICALPDRIPDAPADVNPHAALVAFTLLDQEVKFAAAGPQAETLAAYISRRTGARRSPPEEASFLFGHGDDSETPLGRLPRGSPEFPELGGTAVLTVGRVSERAERGDGGRTDALVLSGPGVVAAATVYIRGLAPAVVDAFRRQNREYPQGIDAFLVGRDGRLVGLPRTARIDRSAG
jgi:alpha-D-ribose 1-methylphosphonate 5-triphosphate synthase subunit PhnH